MTDLDRLIEAVEAGDFPTDWNSLNKAGVAHGSYGLPMRGYCWDAYNDSLDAAKQLHEALLPDFLLMVDMDGRGQVSVYTEGYGGWARCSSVSELPRAYLLAILRSYHSLQ